MSEPQMRVSINPAHNSAEFWECLWSKRDRYRTMPSYSFIADILDQFEHTDTIILPPTVAYQLLDSLLYCPRWADGHGNIALVFQNTYSAREREHV